jgi:hypothetical protein
MKTVISILFTIFCFAVKGQVLTCSGITNGVCTVNASTLYTAVNIINCNNVSFSSNIITTSGPITLTNNVGVNFPAINSVSTGDVFNVIGNNQLIRCYGGTANSSFSNFIDVSNNSMTYNGNNNTKVIYKWSLANWTLNNSGKIISTGWSDGNKLQNVIDSIALTNFTIPNPTDNNLITYHNGLYHFDFNYWTITGIGAQTGGDIGIIYGGGNGTIRNWWREGGWGYIARISLQSLDNITSDSYFYNNLDKNSTNYGTFDIRSDMFSGGSTGMAGSNVHIFNNTSYNKQDNFGTNVYNTAIVAIFNMPGSTVEVRNNTCIANQDNLVIYNNNPNAQSNNIYYSTSGAANIDLSTFKPNSGSPLIGAGIVVNNPTPGGGTDYYHLQRPNPPSIGFAEFSAGTGVTANAGSNQTIVLPTNSAALSGTNSSGSITSYGWSEVSGPNSAGFSAATMVNTNVTGLIQGVYVFQLKVKDAINDSSTATVQVTVNQAPPIANAGNPQTIVLPTNSAALSGAGSTGTGLTYQWSQNSGPNSAGFSAATSANTNVTGLIQGTYVFKLIVTDNLSNTSNATVQITVNPALPVANAGPNQTITLATSTVQLTGAQSTGSITIWLWTQTAGPNNSTINTPNQVNTTVNGYVVGTYTFQLKVKDALGDSSVATMTLTVNPVIPVANGGGNQTIQLPTNSVLLSGLSSTGSISSYQWRQVSGPNTGVFSSPTNATTNYSGLIPGTYIVSLTVKDIQADSSVAKDTIKVLAAPPWCGCIALDGRPYLFNTHSLWAAMIRTIILDSLPVIECTVWPRPANKFVNLEVSSIINGSVQIVLLDSSGKVLKPFSNQKKQFNFVTTIDITNFKDGTYYLQTIIAGQVKKTIKFKKASK